jgi:hypothetical protein
MDSGTLIASGFKLLGYTSPDPTKDVHILLHTIGPPPQREAHLQMSPILVEKKRGNVLLDVDIHSI